MSTIIIQIYIHPQKCASLVSYSYDCINVCIYVNECVCENVCRYVLFYSCITSFSILILNIKYFDFVEYETMYEEYQQSTQHTQHSESLMLCSAATEECNVCIIHFKNCNKHIFKI